MKKYLPSLLITAGILIIMTCGNDPAEEYYQGTPEDSAAIVDTLNLHPELLQTSDLFIAEYCSLALAPASFVEDSYFRTDSTVIKQHVTMYADTLTVFSRFTDLWFTRDTTCTVYLYDTFTAIAKMQVDTQYTAYYFWPPGDTDKVFDTIAVKDTSYYAEKTITGEGWRHIFFEPLRDTTDPIIENGDTLFPIKEPFEWVLKKVRYGTYYFPDRGADIPVISSVRLSNGVKADTISAANYDSLFTGHAMNRLRWIDSLIEYTAGETLDVNITVSTEAALCVYFASLGGSNRVEFPSGVSGASGTLVVDGSGITNLYIEVIMREGFYFVKPDKGYFATVWLIPIRIR